VLDGGFAKFFRDDGQQPVPHAIARKTVSRFDESSRQTCRVREETPAVRRVENPTGAHNLASALPCCLKTIRG